jgi:hypothetical protein
MKLWENQNILWKEKLKRRKEYVESIEKDHKMLAFLNRVSSSMRIRFDAWNPEFDCEKSMRIGKIGDGGKWVCDPKNLFDECIVYSIGANFDLSFEVEFKKIAPNCKIFIFDPTLKGRGIGQEGFSKKAESLGFQFNPWGLDKVSNESLNYYSFRDIMKKLKHDKIDLLKIDCEGCEYSSFQSLFEECDLPFSMLLIELHMDSFSTISKFFSGADKCGLRLYHKEPNYWGCNGYKCMEFAFISEKLALKSHISQHCPESN